MSFDIFKPEAKIGPNPPWRLLLFGDRNWTDQQFIELILHQIGITINCECIIHGDCRGADKLSEKAALAIGFPASKIIAFPADWTGYGKAAGPVRNERMINKGHPNIALGFHDNFYKSKGSYDMKRRCDKHHIFNMILSHFENSEESLKDLL